MPAYVFLFVSIIFSRGFLCCKLRLLIGYIIEVLQFDCVKVCVKINALNFYLTFKAETLKT